jgi:hypothetical protein
MDFTASFPLQRSRSALMPFILGFTALVAAAGFARAQQLQNETVLYNFKGGVDGLNPIASLIFESALYGTSGEISARRAMARCSS